MRVREESSRKEAQRVSISGAKERWLDFLPLEHTTLPMPRDFGREGDELLLLCAPRRGRAICEGRIPKDHGASLFLQAAAVSAFLQAFGLWVGEEDWSAASWDVQEGVARLWLSGPPASVRRGGTPPTPSSVLAALLDRLFARRRRIGHPRARGLFERLLASDAGYRRSEYWVASALRAFPELGSPALAPARARTIGLAGAFLRSSADRAVLEKARALLDGRVSRIFAASSAVTAGGALGLEEPAGAATVSAAARALRERHARESEGRRATWIAVEPERWDELSRRAFETASRALARELEVTIVPACLPPPLLPDEWRREVFVPCGTLNASLRFYERFASLAQSEPSAGRRLAEAIVRSNEWSGFASDATGDAPVPAPSTASSAAVARSAGSDLEAEILEALEIAGRPIETRELSRLFPRRSVALCLERLEARGELEGEPSGRWRSRSHSRAPRVSASRREEICRRWASIEPDPGRRIELWLAGGEPEQALAQAERWLRASPRSGDERWFGLSALLSGALTGPLPDWLEALEAEREIEGGRPGEAEKRLSRLEVSPRTGKDVRRRVSLRLAEVAGLRGRAEEASRRAAAWRRDFSDAPPDERVRALILEARGRAREGRHDAALSLLDEADRESEGLPLVERLEAALARAAVYSLAGRFREETEIYDRWRPAVLASGNDLLASRLLSCEALGLADRREFAASLARLEEALVAARDDAVERARVSINLASTLYHAGRPERCRKLLEEAIGLAASSGRDDLARVARFNRLELAINAGDWECASAEVEELLEAARSRGDDVSLLVALHHRGRLALRRGCLAEAARDNAEARALAGRLSDRLETGELWLEEGDRLVYEGDVAAATRAYRTAAAAPPDRADSAERARERLLEIEWRSGDGPPASAYDDLASLFERDEYAAAEKAARWRVLFESRAPLPAAQRLRAEGVLRGRGGTALADKVFGVPGPRNPEGRAFPGECLRALREAVSSALAGEERKAPLEALGLSGLAATSADDRELFRFGDVSGEVSRRRLDAGAARYELILAPPLHDGESAAIAWLVETLLFRLAPPPLPSDFAEGWRRLGVIAADVSMEEPYRRLARFAPAPVTVLVRGESGSGKEAVARAVHALSPRAGGPFVAVNVPAIPSALLESELFGHARGAFTGADRDRKGLLEEAERGTIFFDEIGDLTPPLQAKLLRALQEREIRRLGENRPRRLDVRVVSATARDLEREVEAGRFREDLYYRLHVAVITLPPLRNRGRDTLRLARHFLSRCAREYGRGNLTFAPEALASLSSHGWPGNVRELQNVVSQAAALAEPGTVVGPELLPEALRRGRRAASSAPENYRARVDEHRRGLILEALERTGGNRSRAARDLGMSRQALLYLIRELNVPTRPRSSH
jgi:transcriptional regulator with AAA-type ATPase domain/tetratricopeptide (TPR) repeat protein